MQETKNLLIREIGDLMQNYESEITLLTSLNDTSYATLTPSELSQLAISRIKPAFDEVNFIILFSLVDKTFENIKELLR